MNRELLRIIDANLNRSREGLRVCEEIARFVLEDVKLTRGFKNVRHRISLAIKRLPQAKTALLESRDSRKDIGKRILNPSLRKNCRDVFLANIQRVKESLRVLEEFSNIFDRSLSDSFARLRFKVYELEKKTIAKL